MTSKIISSALLDEKPPDAGSISLPLRGNFSLIGGLSLMVGLIVGVVSLMGIAYQSEVYPTEEFVQTFLPIDMVKLGIGLPILLGSIWLSKRGILIGLLFWPGALFYVLYINLIFIFAIPFGWMFLLHLILVMLSLYSMISLIVGMDREAIQRQLSYKVPDKLAGGILAGLGFSFLLLAASVMIDAVINQTSITITERALQTADFLVAPAWSIGGILLWRRKAIGYAVGTGLLFQSSMLMISLLIVIILKPFLTTNPFVLSDFTWIFAFSLICFIPLALFIRGVLSTQHSIE